MRGFLMEISIEGAEYIDSQEVARKLGIAEVTLKVKTRAKEVPLPIKLRTMKFWKKSDIESYINEESKK
jgi:predicted DNA-binding transcriptional regulator AlpA